MRWGINARRLEGQPYGMGRYIEYLLKYWGRLASPTDQVEVYLRAPLGERGLQLSEAFRVKQLGPRLTGVLWENLVLARAARGLDVLFCPNYSIPLACRAPTVVATHSVNELHPAAHPWWYRLTYTQLYRLSARKADRVIAPLESTKKEIEEAYGVPGGKIDVIPQGADETFRPLDDPELLRATRRQYLGEDRPYVLFVGQLSPRRNIPTLIRAFALVKKRLQLPHSLLLFGRNHFQLPLEQLAAEAGIPGSVVQTDGRVRQHAELVPVYNAADLFVSASVREGFSITLVEAMACGVPVVVTSCPAFKEVAEGHGLVAPEPTAEALADRMEKALGDAKLREELRARSLRRGQDFRWEDTARRTLGVLRRVAGN